MKIYYLSTARIPDEWAHVFQIMKTCEALAAGGAEVELVVPQRAQTKAGDPFAHAGVKQNFSLVRLPALDLMRYGVPLAFNLLTLTFLMALLWHLRTVPRGSVLYVRGELALPLAWLLGQRLRIVWETHEKPGRIAAYARAFPRFAGVVTVTEYYRQELIRDYGLPEAKALCAPDGVDLASFGQALDRAEARARVGLPADRRIALYSGAADIKWKGLQALRDAALLLPEEYLVVFVGDIPPDAENVRKRYAGFKPRSEMPLWLAAADALVLTGTATSVTSTRYTSPMKLFEYMAAARPIVASDLPSFREVLTDDSAYFAAPDSSTALAAAIVEAVEHPGKAVRSRALAERYSWESRGQHILAFIRGVL